MSPSAGDPSAPQRTADATSAGFWPRVGCVLYEGVLLFGVIVGLVVLPALLVAFLTRDHPGLLSPPVLGVWFFAVLGAYFVYFWSRSGQTLAMLTWRIRLVTTGGRPLTRWRASLRYALSWMWVLPALLIVHLSGLKGWGPVLGSLAAGMLGYAALARLHPDGQYWHDALCRTRLIRWNPPPRP